MSTRRRGAACARALAAAMMLFAAGASWASAQTLIDAEVQVVDQNGAPIPGSFVNINGVIYENGATFPIDPQNPRNLTCGVVPGIAGKRQQTGKIQLSRLEQRDTVDGLTFVWNTAQVTFDLVRDQSGQPIAGSRVWIANAPFWVDPATPSIFTTVVTGEIVGGVGEYGEGVELPYTITLPVTTGYPNMSGSYAQYGYDLVIAPGIGGVPPYKANSIVIAARTPALYTSEGLTEDKSRHVAADTTFTFTWVTRNVTLDVGDQFGNPLPGSRIQILAPGWGGFSPLFSANDHPVSEGPRTPVQIELPVNEDGSTNGMYAAQHNGYDLAIIPGIAGNAQEGTYPLLFRFAGTGGFGGLPPDGTAAVIIPPPSGEDPTRMDSLSGGDPGLVMQFPWEIRKVTFDLVEDPLGTRIEGSQIRVHDADFAYDENLAGIPTAFTVAAPGRSPIGPGIPVRFSLLLPVTEGYARTFLPGGPGVREYWTGYPLTIAPAACGQIAYDPRSGLYYGPFRAERVEIGEGPYDEAPGLSRPAITSSTDGTTSAETASTDGSTSTQSTDSSTSGDTTKLATPVAEKSTTESTKEEILYPEVSLVFSWEVNRETGIPIGLEAFAKSIGCTGTPSASDIANPGAPSNPLLNTIPDGDDGGIGPAVPDDGVYTTEHRPFLLHGDFGISGCLDNGTLRPLDGGSLKIHNTNLTAFPLGVSEQGEEEVLGEADVDATAGAYAALLQRSMPTQPEPTLVAYQIDSVKYRYDGGAKSTELRFPEPPTAAFTAPPQGDLRIDLARTDLVSLFFAVKIETPCARASGLRFQAVSGDGTTFASFESIARIEASVVDFGDGATLPPVTSPDAPGAHGFIAATAPDGSEFVLGEVLVPAGKDYQIVNAAIEFMDPAGNPLNEFALPGGTVGPLAASPRETESACPRLILWNSAELPNARIQGTLDFARGSTEDPTVTTYFPGFFHYTDLNQFTGNRLGFRPNGTPKWLTALAFQPTPYDYAAVPEGRYWPGTYPQYWTAHLQWPASFGPGVSVSGGLFRWPTPGAQGGALAPLDLAGPDSRGLDRDGLFYVDGKDPVTTYEFSPCDPLQLFTETIDFKTPMAFVQGKLFLAGCLDDLAVIGGRAWLTWANSGPGSLFLDERGYRRVMKTGTEFGWALGIFAGDGSGRFEIAASAGPWRDWLYELRLLQGKNPDTPGYYSGWLGIAPSDRRLVELEPGRANVRVWEARAFTTAAAKVTMRVVNEDGSLRPFRDPRLVIAGGPSFTDPTTGASGRYYSLSYGPSAMKTEHTLTIAGLANSTANIYVQALVPANPDGSGRLVWTAFPMLKAVPFEAGKCADLAIDVTAPTIICPADIEASTDAGLCSAAIDPGTPSAEDDRGPVTIEGVRSDGAPLSAPFEPGTTTIQWTATDAAGNSSECTQTIAVIDREPPAFDCPASMQVANDPGLCSAALTIETPTAFDNCGIASIEGVRSDGLALSDPYPVGTTAIRWTAIDIHGNSASCEQAIAVADAEPPAIECPKDLAVSNDPGACSATLAIETPAAFDNCGIASIEGKRSDGLDLKQPFPVGTTYIVWTARDAHGNSASCTQKIEVRDTEPPAIVKASIDPAVLVPAAGSCAAVMPAAQVLATDNCGDLKTLKVEQQPAPGTLLAPGTYSVTIAVTDGSGNGATTTLSLTVLPRLRVIFYQPPLNDDNKDDDIETDTDVVNKFKVGSRIPVKVQILDCETGADITTSIEPLVTVRIDVTERLAAAGGSQLYYDVPENYTGVGDSGGRMVLCGNHFQGNLATNGTWRPAPSWTRRGSSGSTRW